VGAHSGLAKYQAAAVPGIWLGAHSFFWGPNNQAAGRPSAGGSWREEEGCDFFLCNLKVWKEGALGMLLIKHTCTHHTHTHKAIKGFFSFPFVK